MCANRGKILRRMQGSIRKNFMNESVRYLDTILYRISEKWQTKILQRAHEGADFSDKARKPRI